MTLHNEIAKMTCDEVNIKIAKQRDEIVMAGIDVETARVSYPDYCHDWSKAGELLDDLIDNNWGNEIEISHWFDDDLETKEKPVYMFDVDATWQRGHTLKEAIARCWLEWMKESTTSAVKVAGSDENDSDDLDDLSIFHMMD